MIKNPGLPSLYSLAIKSKSASGALASFNSLVDGFPVDDFKVEINAVQSGSGDPSPTNIRPISGWTGVDIFHSGADTSEESVKFIPFFDRTGNVLEMSYDPSETTNNGVTFVSYADGTVYAKGTASSSSYAVKNYSQQYLNAGTYTLYGMPSENCGVRVGENSIGGTVVAYLYNGDTFTVPDDNHRYGFRMMVDKGASVDGTFNPLLVPTSQYDANSKNVFGGTLDVITGELVVDKKYLLADGVNVKATTNYGNFGASTLPAIALTPDLGVTTTVGNLLSSYLKPIAASQSIQAENTICFGNSGQVISLHIGTIQGTDGTHGYSSASELYAAANTYLQANPLDICYTLATPLTYHLTPQQVTALLGANNIWADTGDVYVTYGNYLSSLKSYIDSVLPS